MGQTTRRSLCLGLAALGVSVGVGPAWATTGDIRPKPRPRPVPGAPAAIRPRPRPDPGYHAWVARFQTRAEAAGISRATLSRAFAGARFLPRLVDTDKAQMVARRTLAAQIARMASAARIRAGVERLKADRETFVRIEDRFGVAPEVLAAIWGVESGYGAARGATPVISSLSTLGYAASRGAFFEDQLLAALAIIEAGDIAPGEMRGSWAGAMGHTQFMPATYRAHAVDFDGDGRRDIWSDDPADALASAANYLVRSGWVQGAPWGLEVRLPRGQEELATLSVSEWRARGVTPAGGGALPDHGPATLILPDGVGGLAFLLFANYQVLRRYNDSMKYALGVGHLADRLTGGRVLQGPFGAHPDALDFNERQALQAGLTDAGFDTGGADGVIGDKTTGAIRAYETARGLAVTGLATKGLLDHVRR